MEQVDKRTVLIPIDTSEHSRRAFRWYIKNMKQDNDFVVFVHVVEPVYTTPAVGILEPSPIFHDFTHMMNEAIAEGKRLGHEFMNETKTAGITPKAFIHVDTKPGAALVKSAKDYKANVIVIGNRGCGTLRRTFLGSVSDHVLHHAHIPVVVVPPEQ